MTRKIAIAINLLGILCVFSPHILVWLGDGCGSGSIAIIGGDPNPVELILFADISSHGKWLTLISTCIFSFNIFALWRFKKA